MPNIKPFDGFLVKPEAATSVVSPAYDSVSPEERRRFSESNPENFINTMRLQEDFPADSQPTQEQLLQANRTTLETLLKSDAFNETPRPCMFLYQLGTSAHVQTGLICEVSVQEYEAGKLRKHENTRSTKEDLLARYQEVVGAASSPICLTYAQNNLIDNLISELILAKPDLDFLTRNGEPQKVWCVSDTDHQQALKAHFEKIEVTYLTDGHHRAASGLRYAELMRAKTGGNTGDEPYNQLLVALFPDNQLNLLPFHRCVKGLNGLSVEQLTKQLSQSFTVDLQQNCTEFSCKKHGQFGMLVGGSWYKLTIKPEVLDSSNPVSALDVSLLQDLVLDPILGIKDSRSDARLGYIAGISGSAGISQAVSEGWDIVFCCYATSIQQLMNVADAGELMPPKSTYFDPKPRSGIFLRLK